MKRKTSLYPEDMRHDIDKSEGGGAGGSDTEYAVEETKIGKWIDDKDLYRKIYIANNVGITALVFDTMPTSLCIINDVDIDTLVSAKVFIESEERKVVLNDVEISLQYPENRQMWKNIETWSAREERYFYVIYEYTKK